MKCYNCGKQAFSMAEIDLQISSGTPERSMNIDAGYLELRPLLLASKTFKAVLKPQSSIHKISPIPMK